MTVEELQVRISAEIDDLKRGCEGAKQQLNQVSVSAGKMGDAIKSAFSVAKILAFAAAVVKVSKECTQAYTTQFNAEQKLTTAMKANLNATDNQITSIKKLTSAQQELGVVGDEAQLAGVAQLSMYKLQISSIEKLIPAMNDLIVARDGLNASVGTATDMGKKFAETLNGETESLKEVGIYFTEAEKKILQYGTEADKVNLIIQKVNNTVGNMNANMADTPLGQIQQLNNLMGDIKEQIGQIVSNLTATVIPVLSDILSWVSNILDYAVAFSEVFYEVFGGSKIKVDKNKSGIDNLADSISSVKEEAVEAKKALYALAGFDELNILKYNKTSGTKPDNTSTDDNDQNANNSSVIVSVSANADLAKQNIKDIIAELQKSLEGLDINVSTDEAQQKLDDFKNKWTERLKEFLAVVEADPDNAVKEFIKLQEEFNSDYSQLVTDVEADTTDVGKALKDFKVYWDNQLGQLKISIVVANGDKTEAEKAISEIKNNISNMQDLVDNLNIEVTTEEAQQKLDNFKAEWSTKLKDLKAYIEVHPESAQYKINQFKDEFDTSYSQLVADIEVDTTDGGKSLEEFKQKMDDNIGSMKVEVTAVAGDGMTQTVQQIKDTIKSIIGKILIVFDLDTPEKFNEKIDHIKTAMNNIAKAYKISFTMNTEQVLKDVKTIAKNVFDTIDKIVKTLAETAFVIILSANFGEILESFISLISKMSTGLKEFTDTACEWLKSLTEKVFGPIINWVTSFVADVLKYCGEIQDKLNAFIEQYGDKLKHIVDVIGKVANQIIQIVTPALDTIWSVVKRVFDVVWTILQTLIEGLINLLDWISTVVETTVDMVQPIVDVITKIWNKFNEFYENIRVSANNLFADIKSGLIRFLNIIINAVNSCISFICSGINKLIDGLNKISFDVPEWLPLIGGNTWGFDISHIQAPQFATIPECAKGGVVTDRTVVTVGEYPNAKQNPEIIAPQSILRETMREANTGLEDIIARCTERVISTLYDTKTVIGDEDIARSANRGNNRIKNRAVSFT